MLVRVRVYRRLQQNENARTKVLCCQGVAGSNCIDELRLTLNPEEEKGRGECIGISLILKLKTNYDGPF